MISQPELICLISNLVSGRIFVLISVIKSSTKTEFLVARYPAICYAVSPPSMKSLYMPGATASIEAVVSELSFHPNSKYFEISELSSFQF